MNTIFFFLDSHLAVLSSVVPSAMAPSSGMSYQAEPMENPPSKTPPLTTSLNLGDLLLKLVDVGVVRNQAEPKKQDTEKEKKKKELQVVTVTFDKPETLKSLVLFFHSYQNKLKFQLLAGLTANN